MSVELLTCVTLGLSLGALSISLLKVCLRQNVLLLTSHLTQLQVGRLPVGCLSDVVSFVTLL